MTLEELVAAQGKLKSQKTFTAVFIGFLVGVAIYSATHKGFLLPVALLIFSFLIGNNYSKNVRSIQEEISRRDTVSRN